MAARRLIIVLGILFAVSIVAAAIAPERPITTSTESTTTTTAIEEADDATAGGQVEGRFIASSGDPPTIRAQVGDQLSLSVDAREPLEVEIADYGLIGNAAPASPALFDVVLREAGAVAITDASTGRVIGRVLVKPAA